MLGSKYTPVPLKYRCMSLDVAAISICGVYPANMTLTRLVDIGSMYVVTDVQGAIVSRRFRLEKCPYVYMNQLVTSRFILACACSSFCGVK